VDWAAGGGVAEGATPLGPVACAFFMHPHIHSCWAGSVIFLFVFSLQQHRTLNHPPSGVGACRILWLLIGFFGRWEKL